MAKENITICLLGHAGHGKTTLTSAVSKLYSNDCRDYLDMSKAGWAYVEFNMNSRYYKLIDSKADNAERTYMSLDKIDGAILLVAGTDGPMPQTRQHIILASKIGIKKIIVFISKCDLVDEPELLELVEMEIRELLSYYDYDGDNCPAIYGSALGALYGEIKWEETIGHLIESLDEYIPYNSPNTSNKTYSNTNNNAYTESNNQKSEKDKTMEEIIRNVIQAYSLNKLESDDKDEKVYTDLDGVLRDAQGNRMPKNEEDEIRRYHSFTNSALKIYAIFYFTYQTTNNHGQSAKFVFSTCLTDSKISFRANLEEGYKKSCPAQYSIQWDNLREVQSAEKIRDNNPNNIHNDPLFWLTEESDVYQFRTLKDKRVNIPLVYFARWSELSNALNDIINKNITSIAPVIDKWGTLRTPKPAFELLYRSTEENRKREIFIRNLIEIQEMNNMGEIFKDNPNQQNIYTNVDGTLRDGFGTPMPKELERKIRKWHYFSENYPIYMIYYQSNEGRTNNGNLYIDSFSTCITSNFISFRGIDEVKGEETDYCSYYTIYWDDIEKVSIIENVNKEQVGLLEKDPTFTLTEKIGAYLFSMKRRNDAIIPTPYFANFYADFFIDYIANPEKLEKSRQLKIYREEAEQYFAEKEYQRLLNTLERIQKEDLLSLYAMSDYYFLRISAFVGLNQRENAFREFERFQEYMENAEESEQKSSLGAFLKARSLIYALDKQYYLAAQDSEQVVAIEKEKERPEIVERYRDKQKENYQNFLTHFTVIPVKDRNIITIAKTDRLFKSDHLTLLNYDNLPQVHFPMSHPKINHSYIVHPYKTDSYLPIENYDYELLNDRLNEFFYFLQCLGATSISYEVVEDESSQQASRSQQSQGQNNRNSNYNERSNNNQYGGSAGVNLGFVNAEVGGSSSHANSGSNYGEGGYQQEQSQEAVMNSSLRNFLRMGRNQTFDPLQKPYIPNDLIWYPNEYTWQRIAQQRLNGNMLSHSETLSSSQSETLSISEIASINEELDNLFEEVSSNNAHFDISGKLGIGKFGFKASYNEDKSSTSGHSEASSRKSSSSYRSESKIKKNRDYAVRIHVTFKPMNAFSQDIPYTETAPAPEPKAAPHTAPQGSLSDEEKRYLEEVHFMLQDDGMIDDKERDILQRYRTRFGISQARAKELEDQAMASSTLTPEEQEYVNEYKAALCDGVLNERDRRILSRLAGFLRLSDERVAELEEKYKG